MRVLMLAPRLAPDDLSASALQAASLYAYSHQHTDIALVSGYRRRRDLLPAAALGVDLCGRGPWSARMAMRRASQRHARQWKPDVVLTTDLSTPRCGKPAVALLHHLAGDARLARTAAAVRWGKYRRLLVPSDSVARLLIEAGADERVVRVVPPAISPIPQASREPNDRFNLVCIGGLSPHKGQHLVIDAVARLSPVEKAGLHLSVVGRVDDPVYVAQLKVQAYEQPISIHTDVDATAAFLQRADLLVYPSLVEPAFPYGAVQAVVAGIPLAYSDRPGIRAALHGSGTPVEPGNADAWRDAIRTAWGERETASQAALAGRDAHALRWSPQQAWTAVSRQLQEVV